MFKPDYNAMEENKGKGSGVKETQIIPEGKTPAQLVGYIQLGKHIRKGFQGAPDKAPETAVILEFEFGNAPHDNPDRKLTWATSQQWSPGEFMDWVGISDKLMNNELTPSFAAKTSYMKVLGALNVAHQKDFDSIYEALGEVFLMHCVHTQGKEDVIYANTSIIGKKVKGMPVSSVSNVLITDPDDPSVVYANKAEGYDGRDVGDCYSFDLHNPTPESWANLKPWWKTLAKQATDYHGSALEEMLIGNPDLDPVNSDDSDDGTNDPDPSGKQEGAAEEDKLDAMKNEGNTGNNSDADGI